jgi:hypothetical protein
VAAHGSAPREGAKDIVLAAACEALPTKHTAILDSEQQRINRKLNDS